MARRILKVVLKNPTTILIIVLLSFLSGVGVTAESMASVLPVARPILVPFVLFQTAMIIVLRGALETGTNGFPLVVRIFLLGCPASVEM